jgi:hypothetical protein
MSAARLEARGDACPVIATEVDGVAAETSLSRSRAVQGERPCRRAWPGDGAGKGCGMSEQSDQPRPSQPVDPAPQEPQAQPVAGGDDGGPPAQGEGAPDSH